MFFGYPRIEQTRHLYRSSYCCSIRNVDCIYYYSISTFGHCDFCICYLFRHCGIRTRVISGFGGMGDRIDPKVPPRKNKKVGVRRFYFLHLPAVSNISVMQMRSSEPVGSTASARIDLPGINAFNDDYLVLKYCNFLGYHVW
jgi:hypothetical protein